METSSEQYPVSPLWSRAWLRQLKDSIRLAQWRLSSIGKNRRVFSLAGQTYPYFDRSYNRTWLNERTVEVPIIQAEIMKNKGKRVLEFGNVLSHYFDVSYDIVDKYEPDPKIKNVDIIDYKPDAPYDLIVSISTLEHVGWDETPRRPEKVLAAIDRLKSMLAPGGRCIVTVPIGYNSYLDKYLQGPNHPFQKSLYLKRLNGDHVWGETDAADAFNCRYGEPFPAANGLAVVIYENRHR